DVATRVAKAESLSHASVLGFVAVAAGYAGLQIGFHPKGYWRTPRDRWHRLRIRFVRTNHQIWISCINAVYVHRRSGATAVAVDQRRESRTVIAVIDQKIYLMTLDGAAYYFSADQPQFESLVASATL